jgi:hypothetical protein
LESLLRQQLHALTIGDATLAHDLAHRVALTQEALGVAEKLIASQATTSGVDPCPSDNNPPYAISNNLAAPTYLEV